jgi:predicted Zn-dependent protease
VALAESPSPGQSPASKGWPAGRTYTGRAYVFLSLLIARDRPAEAEAILRRGVARMEGWLRQEPGSRPIRRELQSAKATLSLALRRRGARDGSVALLRELAREDLVGDLVCNNVAWFLATSPDPQFRDPARAVELARRALKQAPTRGGYWNTLGVALYRTGAWDEAIRALTRSMELTRGDSPSDWLFLAMAHWHTRDRVKAQAWYDQAVAWLDRKRPNAEELTRFRAEADALFRSGRPDDAMPSGPDAFAH